jgi:hypothetical protein
MNDERLRTDTAERPAVRAPLPPAAAPVPPPPPPSAPPTDRPLPRSPRPSAPAPPWVAWLVVAISLVLAAVIGTWLVVRPGGGDDATATDPRTSQGPEDQAPAEEPTAEAAPEADPADEEEQDPPADQVDVSQAVDLTPRATVQVPGAAPANNDVTGEQVTFVGPNLLDGDPETCWRLAGDASGRTLTFTFDQPVTVTAVGLLNGYAKTSFDDSGRGFDWYTGNRRVRYVEWVIGDLVVPVTYGDSREVQYVEVTPTQTTSVHLRLLEVSPPGVGPTSRDYTAISSVGFAGVPG